MKIKRILASLLTIALVLTMVAVPVFASGNVAKIGDKEYAKLSDAIGALNDSAQSGEIILLKDWSESGCSINGNPTGITVTLDLNGHTFTSSSGDAFQVFSENTFTLKDSVGTGKVIPCNKRGILLVKGSANITGGTYIANEEGGFACGKNSSAPNNLTITGGTFNVDPSNFTYDWGTNYINCVADGYKAVANGTTPETWTVRKIQADVAQIGSTTYATLAEAVDAVPENEQTTITMIDNEAIDVAGSAVEIGENKNIVLDLNGYTIAGICSTGSSSDLIYNLGTLTIKDSTADEDGVGDGSMTYGADPSWDYDGTISGSYASSLINNRGTLTIDSGYFMNAATGSACYVVDNYSNGYNATFTFNNGLIENTNYCPLRFALGGNNENVATLNGGKINGRYSSVVNYNNAAIPKANIKYCGTVIDGIDVVLYESSGSSNGVKDASNVKFVIESGAFKGNESEFDYIKLLANFVKGGYFVNVVDEKFIADGYECIENPDTNKNVYPYKVVPATESEVEVKVDEENLEVIKDETGTSTEELKQEVKERITDNDAVNYFDKTGIEEVINEMTKENPDAVKELLKSATDDNAVKTEIDSSEDIDNKVLITLTAIEKKRVKETDLFTRVEYDVMPVVRTTVTVGGESKTVEAKIPDEQIKKGIEFRLAADKQIPAGTLVKKYHEDDFIGTGVVEEENGDKFVRFIGTKFSTYGFEYTEDIKWEHNFDSGKYGEEGNKRGVARFLFDSTFDDEDVSESKVLFFDNELFELNENTDSEFKVVNTDGYGAFSADITGLNPEKSYTIYGIGYVKVGDEYYWSKLESYNPDFGKNLTDYTTAQ